MKRRLLTRERLPPRRARPLELDLLRSLSCILPDPGKWRHRMERRTAAYVPQTTVTRRELPALDMCPNGKSALARLLVAQQIQTHLSPQSSHSRTGFHAMRLLHKSHLLTSSPLENNMSSGFHPEFSAAACPLGDGDPLARFCFAPGLRSVNRWTSGAT